MTLKGRRHAMTGRVAVLSALAWPLCLACNDPLTAKNFNQPDIERAFGDPRIVEQVIGSGFQQCHNSTISNAGFVSGLQPQLLTMALEMAAVGGTGPFGSGTRQAIPRTAILNSPGDLLAQNTNNVDFGGLQRLARIVSLALAAIDRLEERGRSLGSLAQDVRGRSFGFFVLGCALGNVALVYDSAAIVSPLLPVDSIPPLSAAADVMRAALRMLDSAVVLASSPGATEAGGFPTPAHWAGGNALSRDDFVKLARTWRARFRAGVARTPDERSAADWEAIVADAGAGITRDLVIKVGGSTGWMAGTAQFLNGSNGNQMAPFYIGMGDVSGAFDEWLGTPLEARDAFLIITPDRRFPQGSSRAAQQADSARASNYLSLPIFLNRTTDVPRDPFSSFYSPARYAYFVGIGGVGDLPIVTRAEMDLLMAEGYIRLNRIAEAAALIDISRVGRGGLPPLSGSMFTALDPVPGLESCVPRVPAPPDFTSTRCGTILEAMKWEKRLETLGVGYGSWFMDSRGWGDLIENTPLEFPVPYQEMQSRHKPYYTLGGGGPSSARRGTYGF